MACPCVCGKFTVFQHYHFELGVLPAMAHPRAANWLLVSVEQFCKTAGMNMTLVIDLNATVFGCFGLDAITAGQRAAKASVSVFRNSPNH